MESRSMLRAWKLRTPSHAVVCLGADFRASMLKLSGSDFSSQWFIGTLRVVLQSRFRRQRIQAHVPRFRETRFGALTIKGETDQVRTRPAAAQAAEFQSSIIESAPHTQTPARRIHADQGYNDEVQPSRGGRLSHALGDGYAEYT